MSDLKERLAAQDREFAPLTSLLKRGFETDATLAPEVDIEAIIAGTLKKLAPKRRRRLLIRFAFATTATALLFALIVPLYGPPNRPDAVPRLSFEDAERMLNTNSLKEVTILYQSGRAEIETDAPVPMVWVRKGEN
ncbi:MAG TPA: hypothetical protein PKH10_04555 [bacterium]|nr:hypothetical protein [bacterium]